jgi:hypothetical protein
VGEGATLVSAPAPLGFGLYFIDVLACLLFCLTLALVGARFGREVTVPVDLPRLERSGAAGTDLSGVEIVLLGAGDRPELFYDGERVGLDQLTSRLGAAPPPSVLVRSEDSVLARVIGAAHAAGVRDIQLAYEAGKDPGGARCCD